MPEMRIADFLRHDAQTYGVPGAPSIERILEVCVEAANWIDKLEQLLAQVKQERDAAVHDLEEATTRVPSWHFDCDYCKDKDKPVCENCEWQWRGVCEENAKER